MNEPRRLFLLSALCGLAGAASLAFAPALANAALTAGSATEALRAVAAAQPTLSYHAAGPQDGRPIVLVRSHGASVESYAETASLLAANGYFVLLKGLRNADAAALGQELLDFIDSMHIPEAVFIGVGASTQAARATAKLRRSRVIGLVLAGDAEAPTANAPTIALANGATPQQIADAAITLARQGKWRT
jgi:pimeloyl-ACP methyl ester carboxylesterase